MLERVTRFFLEMFFKNVKNFNTATFYRGVRKNQTVENIIFFIKFSIQYQKPQ